MHGAHRMDDWLRLLLPWHEPSQWRQGSAAVFVATTRARVGAHCGCASPAAFALAIFSTSSWEVMMGKPPPFVFPRDL